MKAWQDEIKRMLASGLKYELNALANKDFRYLTKTYLPRSRATSPTARRRGCILSVTLLRPSGR